MEIAFFILFFNAGISIIGILIVWPRRKMPAAMPLIFLNSAVIIWSVGYAFELISPELSSKLIWTIVQYIGILIIPIPAFFLSLEHLRKKRLRFPSTLLLLLIIPVFVFIMLCTNEYHHLFYQKFDLIIRADYNSLQLTYGPVFWIHTIYSYSLLIASLVLLIRSLFVLPSVYKRQTYTILFAYFVPWIANIIYILRVFPFILIDPSPLGFTATGVIILFGLTFYNLFDFVPFAADTIINNLNDSIIILSPENTLLKINPQAEELLSCSAPDCIGKDISIVLDGKLSPLTSMTHKERIQIELPISLKDGTSYFDCKISPIKMGKRQVAKVIMLRDITQLKKAQLELKNWNFELENMVLERTDELTKTNDHLKDEISKKELLLKEIHHRVKNNLTMIRSLIVIQSSNMKDPNMLNKFKDLTSRVASIGLIHEKLYTSENFQTIDLDSYLTGLIKSHILTFSNIETPISFTKEIDRLSLNINIIIPLGLIFTELITNAIKYARNEHDEIVFTITAKEDNKSMKIIMMDSGCGYPATVLEGERKSTGLKLIEVFVKQLNGSIIFENDHGARSILTIPVIQD
ncbi:MAG: PAS domain S-box protein [Spirochaetales bacterium]|nr:PAS domain S-box protein [Spirochaetales bacterium]